MHTGKKSRMDKPDPPISTSVPNGTDTSNTPVKPARGSNSAGSTLFVTLLVAGVSVAMTAAVCLPTISLVQEVRELVSVLALREGGAVDGPRDCYDIYLLGHTQSGVYKVYPQRSKRGFDVFCDMDDGGGWLVFQRRQNGTVDFNRGWDEYQTGFGDIQGEFWMGNELLHRISTQGWYELQIDMENFEEELRYAQYQLFRVEGADTGYKLTIEGYSGDGGDGLSSHRNHAFSTFDRDQDGSPGSCAESFSGGWWFENCLTSNLNGRYLEGELESVGHGVMWAAWQGFKTSLKSVQMKVRPL
ncbi:hypothetical protein ScPMuIL_011133 [Solemya velum]